MSIKTHRNHRFECCRRSLGRAILLWQLVIHARQFIHGAVHQLELLEPSLSIFQRARATVAQSYLIFQLHLEMIRRFWKLRTQFQIRFVLLHPYVSIHFVRVIALVMVKSHTESLKHSTVKHKELLNISTSTGLHQSA